MLIKGAECTLQRIRLPYSFKWLISVSSEKVAIKSKAALYQEI